jgi:OTU domain-containing protein 6
MFEVNADPINLQIAHVSQINPDGHCLFAAIADQLMLLSLIPLTEHPYMVTRNAAADFILSHPDDFIPFLPCPEGEDGRGATAETGVMSQRELERYCQTIRNTGAWGGEPEIMALARFYGVTINVVQSGNPAIVTHSPNLNGQQAGRRVMISYHRRMYGLGEVSWKFLKLHNLNVACSTTTPFVRNHNSLQ